jgi:hypothetical protein
MAKQIWCEIHKSASYRRLALGIDHVTGIGIQADRSIVAAAQPA